MNTILQIETLLNMLNTVFAKAVYFKDKVLIEKLSTLRHNIYYGDFDYKNSLKILKEIYIDLNKYERN